MRMWKEESLLKVLKPTSPVDDELDQARLQSSRQVQSSEAARKSLKIPVEDVAGTGIEIKFVRMISV